MNVRLYTKGNRESPVAEGEASAIVQLLAMYGTADLYEVYDGSEYKDARVFAVELGGPVRPSDSFKTPEERMYFEDLHDPIVHARNHMIELIIRRTIENSHRQPHYDPELMAKNASHDVIRLFY